MKNVNVKRLLSMVLCVSMMLSLCACGGKDEPKTHKVDMGGYSVEMTSVDYVLSEYLNKNETIWYLLDEDEGKSSDVEVIFVINTDGTLYYMDRIEYTLGELEQMEDADIISMVKEGYRQAAMKRAMNVDPYDRESTYEYLYHVLFWERLTDVIYDADTDLYGCFENNPVLAAAVEAEKDSIDSVYAVFRDMVEEMNRSEYAYDMMFILDNVLYNILAVGTVSVEEICEGIRNEYADFSGIDYVLSKLEEAYSRMPAAVEAVYNNMLLQAETICEEIQPTQYRMSIITDSTGNHTASMLFAYQMISTPYGTGIDDFNLYYQYPITTSEEITTNCTTVVYDSIFGGYRTDRGLFYTRINANAHFMLDQVGQSELPIDIKNTLSLFE